MSSKCPSRFSEFIIWILRAPLINIPLFVIGILLFWELLSQQDVYNLFIPLGENAKIAEYILWVIVGYIIYVIYQKRNDPVDECRFFLLKIPIVNVVLHSMSVLMMAYLFYYMFLLYIHKFNIATNDIKIEAQVIDISNRGRNKCKPLMKTDFLKKYNPQNQTLFYKFIKKYSFDDICLHKKNFFEGQTVILDIKESPFGMYIENIKAKVY